jgi:tetratricopeptide (TPR) repeat protein
MLDSLAHGADLTLTLSTWSIAMTSADPMNAWQVAELLTAPSRTARTRGVGHRYLAFIAASHGRFAEAERRMDQAIKADPVIGTEFAALLASIPVRPAVSSSQWTAWRSRLTALDLRRVDSSGALASNLVPHPAQHPAVREYLLGLASLGAGDTSGALRHAAELERLPDPTSDSIALDLAHGLRAEVAWKSGDSRAAEASLRQRAERSGYIGMISSPFLSGTRERWRLAQATEANGQLENAVELYKVFGQFSVYDEIYRAPAALRRGALLEKLGRPAEAKAAYEEGIALWSDADPALQPAVTQARARLRALGDSS